MDFYKNVVGHHQVKEILLNADSKSTIFWGESGIGKTTIATCYARQLKFLGHKVWSMPGSSFSSSDFREFVDSLSGDTPAVVLIDELQYLNKKQQQMLLVPIENNKIILVATTTENVSSYFISGIVSRCRAIHMYGANLGEVENFLKSKYPELSEELLYRVVSQARWDIRRCLEICDDLKSMYKVQDGKELSEDVLNSILTRGKPLATVEALKSALQKSIRGGDSDSACLYAMSLLEMGELEMLCRRMRVIVSEDIGLSNLSAVEVVNGCLYNALQLGMPECKFPIIQAVIYLSLSAKSNSVGKTIQKCETYDLNNIVPPKHISSEHADGYKYVHDYEGHIVEQNYYPLGIDSSERIVYLEDTGEQESCILEAYTNVRKILGYDSSDMGSVESDDTV